MHAQPSAHPIPIPSPASAPSPSRRRFLSLAAAGGTAVGATALSGCALKVAGAATGGGESITMMVKLDDISTELIQQAQRELGIGITVVQDDITRLIAMLTSGNPPDLVRGVGALDAPFFAARGVAENLDPYFAGSSVLRVEDLDPANDLWRFDGTTQGRGPRYGMAKDFSQDAMFWFNTEQFDRAGVEPPPRPNRPHTRSGWRRPSGWSYGRTARPPSTAAATTG